MSARDDIQNNSQADMSINSGALKKKQKSRYGLNAGQTHMTIDPEHAKAESVLDNQSQGGTRYVVAIKSEKFKFYGSQSNIDANSQGGMDEEENASRIDYEN